MAFTRFKYDECRTMKSLQQATDPGRWVLNVPGNGEGENPSFMADPHILAQKWGGNLMTNTVDLESELRGVRREANRDCLGKHEYTRYSVPTQQVSYPTSSQLTTEQSRATHPAWWYRETEHPNFDYVHINPQENTCMPFLNNVSTRILEKDYFTPKRDCVIDQTKRALPASYSLIRGNYVGGPTTCQQTNSCGPL